MNEAAISVRIVGVGMVTPVGLTAPATCAALRAGISRLHAQSDLVDRWGDPIVGAQIPLVGDAAARLGAATRRAVQEALARVRRAQGSLLEVWLIVGDENRPGGLQPTEWAPQILHGLGIPDRTITLCEGNAAGFSALLAAHRRFGEGYRGLIAIIGVDSVLDPVTLAYLERADRVKQRRRPRGLLPGEAATCLILGPPHEPSLDSPPVSIRGLGLAREAATVLQDELPLTALAATGALRAAARSGGWALDEIMELLCDLNGEAYRAHELALLFARCRVSPTVHHPADCIGDVGSAWTPLLVGYGAYLVTRRHARGCVVMSASDSGLRGACRVEAA